ncbi:MAG: hypothetical protein K0U21_08295, partial [Proteobacteria bacterium]|nr:hypothetical protein [Pseudomonadota bacterium]
MLPFLRALAIIITSLLTLPTVWAAPDCQYSWLFPPESWHNEPGQKQLEGIQLTHPETDLFTLQGEASVTQNAKKITGNLIRYHQDTDKAFAFGNVHIQDPKYLVTADTAEHDEKTQLTLLNQLNYQLRDNNAWGTADSAVITQDNEQISLTNLRYTGCPIGKEDWWMSFDKLVVDDKSKLATGDDAVLRFHDVPVFYFPKFQFSTADRASGLLMPTIATYYNETSTTSTTKTLVKIPYYFNIAPNLDDTLTLAQMADRGQVIDNEFRYWFPKQKGELTTAFLRDLTTNQDRYRVWWNAQQQLPQNWQLNWSWHDTSDPAFYREVQLTDNYLRSMLYLPRTLNLGKNFGDSQFNM